MTQNKRHGDWMQTVSGRKFWPLDPRPEEIHLEDIAHALSMMCRFNGHCTKFYSVAEHSVYVSRLVPNKRIDMLWGLLHDASEAYIADIVRPAKQYIQGYREAEDNIMNAVADRFFLPREMPFSVKQFDSAILADEVEQIMGPKPEDWSLPFKPTGVVIKGLQPYEAKELFLARANELGIAA